MFQKMESPDTEPCFVDDLLNFSSDIDEEEDDKPRRALASSLKPNGPLGPAADSVRPPHDFVEEELEWISNKDAFPAVESFVGIFSDNRSTAVQKHRSPVSVLDGGGSTVSSNSNSNGNSDNNNCSNSSSSITTLTSCFSSLKAPRRERSKRRCRRRRGDITGRQLCWSQANVNNNKSGNGNATRTTAMTMTTIGRKCQHCRADKTPQWRAGPHGPKTLCNACGVRYKSGRLVPEYRPASSPTFSSELHSNSHRKILEMRRVKQGMGMVVKHPLPFG